MGSGSSCRGGQGDRLRMDVGATNEGRADAEVEALNEGVVGRTNEGGSDAKGPCADKVGMERAVALLLLLLLLLLPPMLLPLLLLIC